MPRNNRNWTPDDEKRLLQLIAEGKSFAAIAKELAAPKRQSRQGLAPSDIVLIKERPAMKVTWNDVGNIQEPGKFPFRDGTIDVTFAEIAIWKKAPDAQFQLMRKNPIQGTVAYVLGKQIV